MHQMIKDVTAKHIASILELISRFKLMANHIDQLYRAGFLKDLFEATKAYELDRINPFHFRAALGLEEGTIRQVPLFKCKLNLSGGTTTATLFEESRLPGRSRDHFLARSYRDNDDCAGEATFFLFAVNKVATGDEEIALRTNGIIPATRREMLRFAFLSPTLPIRGGIVIAVGSTINPHEVLRVQAHPALDYATTGDLEGSRLHANERITQNDGHYRHYYLGRYAKPGSEE